VHGSLFARESLSSLAVPLRVCSDGGSAECSAANGRPASKAPRREERSTQGTMQNTRDGWWFGRRPATAAQFCFLRLCPSAMAQPPQPRPLPLPAAYAEAEVIEDEEEDAYIRATQSDEDSECVELENFLSKHSQEEWQERRRSSSAQQQQRDTVTISPELGAAVSHPLRCALRLCHLPCSRCP
jgi:hypothetical protein